MNFEQLSIPDLMLIKPTVLKDERVFFTESYHMEKFNMVGISCSFKQDNNIRSFQNVLRGLHFQKIYAQAKLVKCLNGKIYDVAVDLRNESSTFCRLHAQELSENNKYQMFIPESFAHGYYVISKYADVSYKCSEIYHPEEEGGALWNDLVLNIKWPCDNPILSDKDKSRPLI